MMYELLKKRIMAAIVKDGRSANAISRAAGVDRGYIGKIGVLKGKKVPEPGALTLKKIALELRVPAGWLIDAINPDETEIARGTDWPPTGDNNVAPKIGEFVEDVDELSLLAFWRSLDTPEKRSLALGAVKGMALDNKRNRRA